MENRRFRLGPFRLTPIVQFSDVGYDSNVFGSPKGREVSDWTVGVTAGVRWVVPVGAKLYVVGEALPQYTWYQKLAARRTFAGQYRTALLGFFNRASLEVGGFNSKTLSFPSAETETRVVQTILNGAAKAEIDVASNLSLYGGIEVARLRYGLAGGDPNFIDVSSLQRQEAAARAGVRYRISPAWDVSAGYEKTQTEFVNAALQRDNQSDAYLLGIHYNRPRFFLSLSGGYRQGKPYNGSTFAKYSNPTGSYFASYFLNRKVEIKTYGRRRVSYGLTAAQYLDSGIGGGFNVQVHPRVLLQLNAETGIYHYGASTGGGIASAARTDRSVAYTGGFSALVYRKMVVSGFATQSEYRSPNAPLNRKVFRFTTSIGFQGLFTR
ncbi:MAG: hypothetical protein M3167_01455 [Acidobacteriota bacterium]|nr:hypothetical protein [Acidobacteriota bacterium]